MFTVPRNKINYLKENGVYDYFIDMEETGNLKNDNKEEIYQYFLANAIEHMTDEEHSKFIDRLIETLETKNRVCSELQLKEHLIDGLCERCFDDYTEECKGHD
ncbi:hypothetical protein [Clostridium faecium]|uniref:Uncharacterized protein n=1 Tax=Clostridium faecium TaxID=2762223 RepID=A0ABR8YNH4_9CLOT|nr:hypothetical protein [Clostridium faecium]MBD8045794.1 hypothetical protein [Clostridium faecium]